MSDGIPRDKLCEMLTVAEKRIVELEERLSQIKTLAIEHFKGRATPLPPLLKQIVALSEGGA